MKYTDPIMKKRVEIVLKYREMLARNACKKVAAKYFGLPPVTLDRWSRIYAKDGEGVLKELPLGRPRKQPVKLPGEWKLLADFEPPQGATVETKIDDAKGGARNFQRLILHSNHWWIVGMTAYVRYTPTHWREI